MPFRDKKEELEYRKKYYQQHKEDIKTKTSKYYKDNRDERIQKCREYYYRVVRPIITTGEGSGHGKGKVFKKGQIPWNKGLNNYSENHKARSSNDNRKWRKECLLRDNFICQISGKSGGKLQVHHINNFADFPELRFITDNGITLCKKCHCEIENPNKTIHT